MSYGLEDPVCAVLSCSDVMRIPHIFNPGNRNSNEIAIKIVNYFCSVRPQDVKVLFKPGPLDHKTSIAQISIQIQVEGYKGSKKGVRKSRFGQTNK